MSEQEFLTSADPAAMITHLRFLANWPRPIDRKLRLFAVACCNAIKNGVSCPTCDGVVTAWAGKQPNPANCWQCKGSGRIAGLTDPRSRRAVEVAERFADGLATEEEVERAINNAAGAGVGWPDPAQFVAPIRRYDLDLIHCSGRVLEGCQTLFQQTPATQADLIRDIFGNPYRLYEFSDIVQPGLENDTMFLPTHILRWNDRTVPRIAQHIYGGWEKCQRCEGTGKRRNPATVNPMSKWLITPCPDCHGAGWIEHPFNPSNMPILADALLDAGADDEEILMHCRSEGPHVRGCWAIDLLLGKS